MYPRPIRTILYFPLQIYREHLKQLWRTWFIEKTNWGVSSSKWILKKFRTVLKVFDHNIELSFTISWFSNTSWPKIKIKLRINHLNFKEYLTDLYAEGILCLYFTPSNKYSVHLDWFFSNLFRVIELRSSLCIGHQRGRSSSLLFPSVSRCWMI